ncbi:MAG: class I SAM-dependent methyltransferase [Candidatus Daviesbacteria bacterium]|nr:MAG: class I SAM-dependent methyltransferase [Candidatus Daviesbacteria bacterium]
MGREFTEQNFLRVSDELEEINRVFEEDIDEVLVDNPDYPRIWLPPDRKIRLWSVPRTTAEFLRTQVLIKRPPTILELGTSAGYSALWMAAGAREYGGKVYTVEVARPKSDWAAENFEEARLGQTIFQYVGWAEDILRRSWRGDTDFVFLDADKPNYLKYMQLLEPYLTEGAVIIADNALDYGDLMQDYLNYITTSPDYYSYLLRIDHGLMISVKLR